jgi:TRAP-type C4-dicarboxylate transport system permease small subunit
MLERLDRFAEQMARITVWIGGAMLLAAAVLVTIDVLGRKTGLVQVGGSDELAAYAFAIGTAWAFSFVLLQRGNVRIDALYQLLPFWARSLLDVVSLAALAVFVGFLVWRAAVLVETTIELGARSVTPMRTPLIVPQGLWLIGLVVFLLVILLTLVRTVVALARRDFLAVQRAAGAAGVQDEAEDELRALVGEPPPAERS